jgi:thymidylate kinase
MSPAPRPGRLIVLEGLDGVGKSTLSRRLAETLGAALESTPGRAIRGAREAFEAELAPCRVARSLAYGATVIAAGARVEAALRSGQDVVMDRYWLSTLVHAPAQARPALDAMAAFVRPADHTLYLRLSPQLRAARLFSRGATDEDRRTLQAHAAYEAAYLEALAGPAAGRATVIDAGLDEMGVLEAVLMTLGGRMAA